MHTTNVTTRLGLMKPEGTDSFLRQDFLDTLAILDANPGAFICTSTTHPTGWTSGMAGRLAMETDTGRLIRWDGSIFNYVYNFPFVSTSGINPSVTLNSGASATYTLQTYTYNRYCKVVVFGHAWVAQAASGDQAATATLLLDGVDISSWSVGDGVRMTGGNDRMAIPLIGVHTATAASHTLAVRIDVGSLSSAPITFYGAKIAALYAEPT